MPRTRRWTLLLLAAGFFALLAAPSSAAVVVLVNRGTKIIDFTLQNEGEAAAAKSLRPREQLSWSTAGPVTLKFGAGATAKQYQLDPNSAYYFGNLGANIDLQQIGLGSGTPAKLNPAIEGRKHAAPLLTIPVKVLVDDEELQNDATWKERIRARLAATSAIFEPTARVRFEIVAAERWDSADGVTDFAQSLTEFEREVSPEPGWIAIGFTSQYNKPQGATKLGGTRGPFHRHLLMREWPQHVSERERLEVLVHELGHILGSAHSPEQDSVMRPVLGDRVARLKDFIIGFDPLNTIAMWLIAEEMRLQRVRGMEGLSTGTRKKLAEIYDALAKGLPQDPAAPVYLRMAMPPGGLAASELNGPQEPDPLGVRLVSDAIWLAAERNALLPPAESGSGSQGVTRLTGDAIADYYYREAAVAARMLPAEQSASAFLVALSLALVDPKAIDQIPPLAKAARAAGWTERANRREVLGAPTLRGRGDWLQHFTLSGGLSTVFGPQMSEAAGLTKELADAREGGSGFSLADYAADLSGLMFAQRLRAAPQLLEQFEDKFVVNDFMTDATGLEEGLSRAEFLARYGGPKDNRFQERRVDIMRAIAALKGYEWWNLQTGTKILRAAPPAIEP